MENGRKVIGVRRSGQPIRKRVISGLGVDLHGTVVVPENNQSQSVLVKRVAEEVLGVKIPVSAEKLMLRTDDLRLKMESVIRPELRFGSAYWGLINAEIYKRWGCDAEKGVAISTRLISNPDFYEMPEERKMFFDWLFGEAFPPDRVKLFVLSNSDQASATAILEKTGMIRYFAKERILTPESFDGVGKPASFGSVLSVVGAPAEQTLVVGNSGFYDVPAARFGINVLWLRAADETLSRKKVRERLGAEAASRICTAGTIAKAKRLVEERYACAA